MLALDAVLYNSACSLLYLILMEFLVLLYPLLVAGVMIDLT